MLTEDAINFYGGVAALARALGISRAAIYQWGDRVPQSSSWKLQVLTKGKLRVDGAATGAKPAERSAAG
jgi:hypothetical protein